MKFGNEQLRTLENLATAYDAWLTEARARPASAPSLHWKTVRGKDYLYEKNSAGNARSLGPRSRETAHKYGAYEKYRDLRSEAKTRLSRVEERIYELGRMYRALGLPLLDATAGAILREADVRRLLGKAIIVVGTNAMAAYEAEAQVNFPPGLDTTNGFDLAWSADLQTSLLLIKVSPTPILDLLKAVDETFTTNTERTFEARNSDAYQVDVLCAPSVQASYPHAESLRPIPLPEQEWLLRGNPISQILCDRTHQAVRVVAPDPRWMALHKLWLSDKPERNRKKSLKDRQQGELLLSLLKTDLRHFKLDAQFMAEVPQDLRRYLPPEAQ